MKTKAYTLILTTRVLMVIISASIWLQEVRAQNTGIHWTSSNISNQSNYDIQAVNGNIAINSSFTCTNDSSRNLQVASQKQKTKLHPNAPSGKNQFQTGNNAGGKGSFSLKDRIFFILLSKY